ncbi:DUF5689 domain-containing protein [Ochrovirga pacifica]|uniref:DUF5689 domain-containing protein n=1 Tax=Ochrovirga pacifica TaxID=1042376 RepID=UPI000255A511|nr:DUF5689 domain-containing protein [Ochrovirga pacifica]
MKHLIYTVCAIFCIACVEDFDHNNPQTTINEIDFSEKTEITFQQLYNLHNNSIGKDTVVVGYVISTDVEGNFYKELYLQNTEKANNPSTNNPRMGLRVRVGLRAVSNYFAMGRKVMVNLEGLKKTTSNNVLTLGAPSSTYIKDILEFDVKKHLVKLDEIKEIIPKSVLISELNSKDLNTLIRIPSVQFQSSEFTKPLAGLPTDDFDGKRVLEYCGLFRKDSILLETSNFADFSNQIIPQEQLDVTGIYSINFQKQPVLILNQHKDLQPAGNLVNCKVQQPNVLLTEIADPKNASNARYVELYNAEEQEVDLQNWQLVRVNNGTTAYSISLDGIIMNPKGFVVIAKQAISSENNSNFVDVFNVQPTLESNQLDGNGDDAYILKNEQGQVVDVFGEPDVDGTATYWEYTDGRVYRNLEINQPNAIFTPEEWTIEVANKLAPHHFSPFSRKSEEIYQPIQTADLMITEVADPPAEAKARFVELYNPTNQAVSLKNWSLVRYNYTSSKNTKASAALPMSLDGLSIPSKGFILVARDTTVFRTFYGLSANLENSSLDGNGDDAYELIDPFGKLIDVYGNANEDGTGTLWEYTDGIAVRKPEIHKPNNRAFTESEWEILDNGYSPKKREAGQE